MGKNSVSEKAVSTLSRESNHKCFTRLIQQKIKCRCLIFEFQKVFYFNFIYDHFVITIFVILFTTFSNTIFLLERPVLRSNLGAISRCVSTEDEVEDQKRRMKSRRRILGVKMPVRVSPKAKDRHLP